MLGIFALLVIGAIVCVRLGAWQIDRAIGVAERQAAIEQSAREDADPVPVADVVAPQIAFTQAMVGTRVEVTGRWEPDLAYWVPRELDGEVGYLLLTGFREDGTGALMPVARGWVAERDAAAITLPAGEVTVMGFLDGSEAAESGIAEGADEIDAVSSGALVNVWGGPIYSGYLILISADPDAGAPGSAAGTAEIGQLPPPELPTGGLNLRNLAYAAEWFVFGGFALFLWWRMVRDEARVLRAERDHDSVPA